MALLFGMAFMVRGIEPSKCSSPVDCCSIPLKTIVEERPKRASPLLVYFSIARYRKVTTWARLQMVSGAKRLSLTPVVMPFSTAHRTAL